MNIFTTDHPLNSASSWFDSKEYPRLSFVCCGFVLALLLTPLVLVQLYYYAISDIGAEPTPFPDPWLAFAVGSVLAFAISMSFASLAVLGFRVFARIRHRRHHQAPTNRR